MLATACEENFILWTMDKIVKSVKCQQINGFTVLYVNYGKYQRNIDNTWLWIVPQLKQADEATIMFVERWKLQPLRNCN